ncbi:3-phenylpropionate/cinnamic acid dioxygenase subunit beta [Acinetobacter puyangensis]|uniref:Phenylpropionate dioxygenase beta subunit n=1 Tax=Acinetobacter puyangensis TaxID=1096779 RepID=A0A240E2X7_9GAMM|nr:3-phenylpropionate/cinnamic acid dioxygenase subunit beta [Acinetobacter puyangensis]SNX43137.1 phenylpropionate dioxygenase beta subunit [Acinetobacter puyangensis]
MNQIVTPLTSSPLPQQIDCNLYHEISQFMYAEAQLVDDWNFRAWLDVLAEDILYTLKTTTNAQTRDRRKSISPPSTWIFNDSKHVLERRVAKLETGMSWSEEPPSRTRHLITNIRVEAMQVDAEYKVYSNYLLYRSQKEKDIMIYVGKREDIIRKIDTGLGWLISKRDITLDQATLTSHNITVFF